MLLISTTYRKDNIYKYYLSCNLQIFQGSGAVSSSHPASPSSLGVADVIPKHSFFCHDQSCVWKDVDGHQVTWLSIVVDSCWIYPLVI